MRKIQINLKWLNSYNLCDNARESTDSVALAYIGDIYKDLFDIQLAEKCFKRALEFSTNNSQRRNINKKIIALSKVGSTSFNKNTAVKFTKGKGSGSQDDGTVTFEKTVSVDVHASAFSEK